MTGYRTRKQLADALHGEIAADDAPKGIPAHGCTEDHDYAYRNGRASDKLAPDHCSPFTAHSAPADWGTPNEAARIKAARRERRYVAVFKLAIWCVLLTAAFMAGLNARIQREAAPHTDYRQKAARLALSTRACELDPREGCLVCMHKDATGQASVVTHC